MDGACPRGQGLSLKSASSPALPAGGPAHPVGSKQAWWTGPSAGHCWQGLGPYGHMVLMKRVFQADLQERMAHVGGHRQMPWLPVLVVSGSECLPRNRCGGS